MPAATITGKSARIGLAKQTTFGTPVPPSSTVGLWPRWQQGARITPMSTTSQIFEGDGSLDVGLNVKTAQWGEGIVTCLPRPKELAMLFTAFTGTGSDTAVIISAGPNYTHTIAPIIGNYANDLYTLGMNVGSAYYAQLSDAICHSLHLTTSTTQPQLQLEAQFTGIVNSQSVTPATTAFLTDGPFYFYSSNGSWTLDTLLVGSNNANWAAAVRSLDLTFSRELRPESFMAESITPLQLTAFARTISGSIEFLWQDGGLNASAYFNGGTTDSATIPYGNIQMVFKCDSDNTQTFTLTLPKTSLKSPTITPSLDGSPITQTAEFTNFRNAGAGPFTAAIINTSTTAY